MEEEVSLWKGSSSQWLNLWHYLGALVLTAGISAAGIFTGGLAFIALVLPIGWAIFKYLGVRTTVYELTSERLRITRGIINQHVDEVELYRVKDSQLFRTWWMRLTRLAAVRLSTSDRSLPELEIPAVSGGLEMRELLRKQVELIRDRKRVREIDFEEQPEDGISG